MSNVERGAGGICAEIAQTTGQLCALAIQSAEKHKGRTMRNFIFAALACTSALAPAAALAQTRAPAPARQSVAAAASPGKPAHLCAGGLPFVHPPAPSAPASAPGHAHS